MLKIGIGTFVGLFLCIHAGSSASAGEQKEFVELALLKDTESVIREFKVEPSFDADKAIVVVLEQKLEEFLKLAARHNGVKLQISSPVPGILKNAQLPIKLQKLLPRLGQRFDLAWHMHDKQLFVSRASAKETRELSLAGIELNTLRDHLDRSRIGNDEYIFQVDGQNSVARLEGAPSYLDAITTIAEELRK